MGMAKSRATVATAFRYREHFAAALGLLAVLLAGLFVYPGTHFLTSDTQIWTVMMENRLHPEVLAQDLLAQYPHVGLSFYDEIINTLRRWTGLPVQTVMMAHLVLFRAVMLAGAYLLAYALTQSRMAGLWIAGALQVVYFIPGPTVCVMEVEPVPRAYSLSLGLLAVGLFALGKRWGGAWALAGAMLFQAVMVYPVMVCLAAWKLFAHDIEPVHQRLRYWIPVVGAAALVVLLSIAAQGGSGGLFEIVPEWLREVQRVRASYNWVSLWPGYLVAVHVLFCVLGMVVAWRSRLELSPLLRWFLGGVPVIALVSIPAAWLAMEKLHLMAAAQTQPARALATLYAVSLIALMAAAWKAAQAERWFGAAGWLLGAYSIVFLDRTILLARQMAMGEVTNWWWWLWAPGLAVAATAALRLRQAPAGGAAVALCLLMAAPFGIYRLHFGVDIAAQDARTPEVLALSAWAEENTAVDAVFLFPGFERSTQPGVFRAAAKRTVYVDWKAGGQVNFDVEFAEKWWERWNAVGKGPFRPSRVPEFARRGIQYIVVTPGTAVAGAKPLYANGRFEVYRVAELLNASSAHLPAATTASK